MSMYTLVLRWLGYTSIVWLTGLIVAWFRPHDQIGWVCTMGFSAFLVLTVTLVTFTQARSDVQRRAMARRQPAETLGIFSSGPTFIVDRNVGDVGLSGFTAAAGRKP